MVPSLSLATAMLPVDDVTNTARLSSQILDYASQFAPKRRLQYLAGRIILAELLFHIYGITSLPDITQQERGRPFFCDPDLPDFNISHSGDRIMVALVTGCHVGIDIEIMRPRKALLKLANYCFSSEENCWLHSIRAQEQANSFWQFWTIREALLKLVGKSVWCMKDIVIDPRKKQLTMAEQNEVHCYSYQDHILSWALATDHRLAHDAIHYWDISYDLTELTPISAPDVVQFSTIT